MRTIAILPIKSLGAAKQRLAGLLGSGSRQALAQAMFSDVLAALRQVEGVEEIVVVTANDLARSTARGERVTLLHDDAEAGQSAAAAIGIDYAVEHGFERVLLVPGDTPLLDPAETDALLAGAAAQARAITIVPDRHGTGTNALVLSPPRALTPSFGPGSLERHLSAARASGLEHAVDSVPSLVLDVDTPDDLGELAEVLETRRGRASMTRGALRQLDRCQVRGSGASRRRTPVGSLQVSA